MNHKIITVLDSLYKQYQTDQSLHFKTRALQNAIREIKKHEDKITSGEYALKNIKSIGKGASGEVAKIALGYILKTQRKYLEESQFMF